MSIKKLEERIVNLTKVSTNNVRTTEEAELRQLDMRGPDPPRIISCNNFPKQFLGGSGPFPVSPSAFCFQVGGNN